MTRASARFSLVFVTALSGTAPCFAADPIPEASTAEIERCVEAHDNARVLMLEEKWIEAREGMMRCQEPACPLGVRSDCAAWLEEVTRILPTVLIVVERDDDGKAAVELELDGRKLELPNPPHPIEVLPGTHLVRVSLAPFPQVERVVVLGKGEKNHLVRVRFVRERPPTLVTVPRAPRPTRPIPVTTYALAGGAVAALATSTALWASGLSARSDALDRCAPGCTTNERESIDARLLAGDVFGVVGLVLGGFAVYTFVDRPTVMETAIVPRVEVTQNGPGVSVAGRF